MKNARYILLVLILLLSVIGWCNSKIEKKDVNVLVVSSTDKYPVPKTKSVDPRVIFANQEYGKRSIAFKKMLDRYFTKVEIIDSKDYKQEDSFQYDVTIFDKTPRPIEKGERIKDPATGKLKKIIPAKYLTEDFDRPAIFISSTASAMGKALGSKLDWYCLCLRAHAHHINTDHEIFRGPFPVDITLVKRKTPKNIFHYGSGVGMPDSIPMWKVNTRDYKLNEEFPIGMVSRGAGFEDSPDTEIISSGECLKDKTAIALGRHGNFFLWGFSGSPDYFTEEAKTVFANLVVYMSKFKGTKLLVRKYNDRIATRDYVTNMLHFITKRAYDSYIEFQHNFYENRKKEQERIRQKQADGKQLTKMEEITLGFKIRSLPTRGEYLKSRFGRHEVFRDIITDTTSIRQLINENLEYFYSEPDASYTLKIDEDAKSLKIPNRNIRLIEKSIEILEKGTQVKKAKRILNRYTFVDFKTPQQWRAWFEKNKSDLFFTETGGYVWMVNRADVPVVKKEKAIHYNVNTDQPTNDDPVSVGGVIVKGKEGKAKFVLKMDIMSGYHIYAYVESGDPYVQTNLKLLLPEGISKVGDWKLPSPIPYVAGSETLIYQGELFFEQELLVDKNKIDQDRQILFEMEYQCCDDNICFPPATKTIKLSY